MQLRTVMRNMARMWRSSLIVFVIAAIVLGALSYVLAKPKYRVEGDVLFSSQAFHAFDTPDAAATYTTSLVTTYGTYAKSASLLDEVGQSVSPQIDGATLQQAVVISTAPMMVSVSFMDSDKDRATAVVKTITDSLQEQVKKSAPDVDGKPALSVANSSVITTQVADSAPSAKRSALIGVLGGLVLALLVLLVRALASTRIGDVADLADVTDSSILGVIPRKGSTAQGGGELEAVLGRNLSFIPPRDGLRTVLLAPSLASEDASTVTLAAADRLHADGHSVVVVDADLRRATATKAAGVTSSAGLSDLLAGRATLQQATYDRSGAPIVAAGTTVGNAAELLATETFAQTLAELGREYDTVLLVGAPLLTYTDSSVIAAQVASVVPVVQSGTVRRSQLQQTLESLDLCRAHVGGLVLTDARVSASARQMVGAGK